MQLRSKFQGKKCEWFRQLAFGLTEMHAHVI